jgi:hypothetical protein
VADFIAKRKTNADNVVIQDAVANNVQVKLDQHVHTSFLIRDGEESRAFQDLVEVFLRPAVIAQARFVDRLVLHQYAQFLGNSSGGVGAIDVNTAVARIISARQTLNVNKAPMENRNMVLNSFTESTFLSIPAFTQAQAVGDQGQALQQAALGQKFGFNMYTDQNMPVILAGTPTAADTTAAAYPIGTSTIVLVTGTAGNFPVGRWLRIAGDDLPHMVTAYVSGTKTATIYPPLARATASGAAVTVYVGGAVNNATGYPAGYAKEITVDGFTVAPQVGQIITFDGDSNNIYTAISINGIVGVTLDKPLVNPLVDNQPVYVGPEGQFNLAFLREAIALVVRPLAPPKKGTGALSSVMNENNLSMRTTITYDGNKQGHLVTLDFLCGIAVLDKRLGAVLVG